MSNLINVNFIQHTGNDGRTTKKTTTTKNYEEQVASGWQAQKFDGK